MTVLRTLLSALLCASALLPFGAAHAVGVVTFAGYTSADNFDPFNCLQDVDSGTTTAPATYGVSVDGNVATSSTDASNGGSAYGYSRSAGTYSTAGGFMTGGHAGANTTISYQVMLIGPDGLCFALSLRRHSKHCAQRARAGELGVGDAGLRRGLLCAARPCRNGLMAA
ncbi:MAG: hypothetical protein Q7K57_43270 [Burkholderiaceae bacterium]|nr:hypothetical protein [Burkholderiaceae bacterium]